MFAELIRRLDIPLPERLQKLAERAWFPYLVLALPFAVMAAITGLSFRYVGDEPVHLVAVFQFADAWPLPLFDYDLTGGPLPYWITAGLGHLLGFELWKLRLLVTVLSYGSTLMVWQLARHYRLPYPVMAALLFAFYPYTLLHSVTYYTDQWPLLFGLAALLIYLRADQPGPGRMTLVGLLSAAAILSRQNFVILPVMIGLAELLRLDREHLWESMRGRLLAWVCYALPVLLLGGGLFLVWRGVSPPSVQDGTPLFFVGGRATFIAVMLGAYFLPFLLTEERTEALRQQRWMWIVALISIPVFLFAIPEWNEVSDINAVNGVLNRILYLPDSLGLSLIRIIVTTALWLVGLLLILQDLRHWPWDRESALMLLWILLSFPLMSIVTRTTERYYLPLMVAGLLLFLRNYRRWPVLLGWLILMLVLAGAFTYWQIALKDFTGWQQSYLETLYTFAGRYPIQ